MRKLIKYSFYVLFIIALNSCDKKYDCKVIETEESYFIKNTEDQPLLFTYEKNSDETKVYRTDWLLAGEVFKVDKTFYSYKKKNTVNVYNIKIVGQTTMEQANGN